MEVREILIANTKTQKRTKLNTNATTLGELKEVMRNAGINFEGMTFTEGISKTQLLEDASLLPQNNMYKGQLTNNLVILLTNTKKNIASGISVRDRKAAFSVIKRYALQDKVKETFGRDYTRVSNPELFKFIEENTGEETNSNQNETPSEVQEPVTSVNKSESPKTKTLDAEVLNCMLDIIMNNTLELICKIASLGVLSSASISRLAKSLNMLVAPEPSEPVSTSDGTITDEDIDDMLDDLNY